MSVTAEDRRIGKLLKEEFDHHKESTLHLTLDPYMALALLGTVQLAARHPFFNDSERATIKRITDSLVIFLEKIGPTCGEVARMGFDRKFDRSFEE
jgi:hypothetical protein